MWKVTNTNSTSTFNDESKKKFSQKNLRCVQNEMGTYVNLWTVQYVFNEIMFRVFPYNFKKKFKSPSQRRVVQLIELTL
jgi:hypothetical protein